MLIGLWNWWWGGKKTGTPTPPTPGVIVCAHIEVDPIVNVACEIDSITNVSCDVWEC